jgi:hypothetical protein
VQCFNAPKANAFDYNLLEPLQKLLRLSSPVAASLARPDLFSGILQKLNHKKAVVRLNLLRIVRSICEPGEKQADSIRSHRLFEAIQRLAENDNAVLVRNMASELVKSNLEKDQEGGSGGRTRPGHASRRTDSYTPPGLHPSISAAHTPTHVSRASASSAFFDGSVTPRRIVVSSNNIDSLLYRPSSREGPQMQRKTSGEMANGASGSKSRLPRTTIMRRISRSSMDTPLIRDEAGSTRRDSVRLSHQSRSTASPAPGGIAPQTNSKRRTRPPNGEIKWS